MSTITHSAAAVPAAILVLLVFSCGCGDYVPNHDIIVIALHPDGSEEWSRILDTGYDDVASGIVETGTGDLMIAAGNATARYGSTTPKLIRLSRNGTVLAEHPCPVLEGGLTAIILTGDGNMAAATYNGQVGRFDPGGNLTGVTETGMTGVWSLAPAPEGGVVAAGSLTGNYPTGSVVVYSGDGTVSTRAPYANETVETPGCRETVLEAGDKKIPVTECVGEWQTAQQAAVTRISRNGTILWQQGYGAYGPESAWSIAAGEGGDGYYIDMQGPAAGSGLAHRTAFLHIRKNGSVDWIAEGEPTELWYPAYWDIGGGLVRAIVPGEYAEGDSSLRIRPAVVAFGENGTITGRQDLSAVSRIVIPTADGGYFSAGFSPAKEGLAYRDSGAYGGDVAHAMKLRADGSREWETTITDVRPDTIKKVIQTSDGGYVILATRQNR
ncbi:MAG: hypothetical protein WC367_02615 [Methanoregula sp.]|jgi:hypothetical protein